VLFPEFFAVAITTLVEAAEADPAPVAAARSWLGGAGRIDNGLKVNAGRVPTFETALNLSVGYTKLIKHADNVGLDVR
jgi:hypothetical protein